MCADGLTDWVCFNSHQKNHTVTQSSFEDPCRRLNANGVTGFDSGLSVHFLPHFAIPAYSFSFFLLACLSRTAPRISPLLISLSKILLLFGRIAGSQATAGKEWSCKFALFLLFRSMYDNCFSAINSDESSARNFQAFQNLAITLNGTGTASGSTPSSTSSTKSGASHVEFGFASLLFPLAFLLGLAW